MKPAMTPAQVRNVDFLLSQSGGGGAGAGRRMPLNQSPMISPEGGAGSSSSIVPFVPSGKEAKPIPEPVKSDPLPMSKEPPNPENVPSTNLPNIQPSTAYPTGRIPQRLGFTPREDYLGEIDTSDELSNRLAALRRMGDGRALNNPSITQPQGETGPLRPRMPNVPRTLGSLPNERITEPIQPDRQDKVDQLARSINRGNRRLDDINNRISSITNRTSGPDISEPTEPAAFEEKMVPNMFQGLKPQGLGGSVGNQIVEEGDPSFYTPRPSMSGESEPSFYTPRNSMAGESDPSFYTPRSIGSEFGQPAGQGGQYFKSMTGTSTSREGGASFSTASRLDEAPMKSINNEIRNIQSRLSGGNLERGLEQNLRTRLTALHSERQFREIRQSIGTFRPSSTPAVRVAKSEVVPRARVPEGAGPSTINQPLVEQASSGVARPPVSEEAPASEGLFGGAAGEGEGLLAAEGAGTLGAEGAEVAEGAEATEVLTDVLEAGAAAL